jgi:KDO2-lipid IV(A) lauroyltransferase
MAVPGIASTLTEQVAAAGYTGAWWSLRHVPAPVARRSFDLLADQLWATRSGGIDQLERNLQRVLGPETSHDDLRRASREAARSYLQYWCDVFRLPSMPVEVVRRRCTVDGFDRVVQATEAGRGVVLVLGHCGNWDLVGAWLADRIGGFTTVAEHLKPESLHRRFLAYRRSLGMEVLPLDAGARTVATLGQRLRAGGVVCLLADRDLTGSGQVVDLFGEPARIASGPAALAAATGALLLPVEVWIERDRDFALRTVIHDPIAIADDLERQAAVGRATDEFARRLETFIAARPTEWHMMQPVWLADRHDDGRGR